MDANSVLSALLLDAISISVPSPPGIAGGQAGKNAQSTSNYFTHCMQLRDQMHCQSVASQQDLGSCQSMMQQAMHVCRGLVDTIATIIAYAESIA